MLAHHEHARGPGTGAEANPKSEGMARGSTPSVAASRGRNGGDESPSPPSRLSRPQQLERTGRSPIAESGLEFGAGHRPSQEGHRPARLQDEGALVGVDISHHEPPRTQPLDDSFDLLGLLPRAGSTKGCRSGGVHREPNLGEQARKSDDWFAPPTANSAMDSLPAVIGERA